MTPCRTCKNGYIEAPDKNFSPDFLVSHTCWCCGREYKNCENCSKKVKMAQCRNCQQGWIEFHHKEYISHEMAMDAGDLELEGHMWDWGTEIAGCSCCGGDYRDCRNCAGEFPSSVEAVMDGNG